MQDGGADNEEGPPSQRPTPRQGATRSSAAASAGTSSAATATAAAPAGRAERGASNPFRNQQSASQQTGQSQPQGQGQQQTSVSGKNVGAGGSGKDRPKSSEEIGQAASAYRGALLSSRSERGLLTEGAEVVPASAIPAGNILTAVRNEANPSHIPPGSRTKQPKTPSPKKMDQILQRDMLNKRRFQLQQQQLQQQQGGGAGEFREAAPQGGGYATRSNRYSLPNQGSHAVGDLHTSSTASTGSGGSGRGHVRSHSASDFAALQQQAGSQQVPAQAPPQQQAQPQQVSRFGKLLPSGVPFPNIASRVSNITGRSAAPGAGGGSSGVAASGTRRAGAPGGSGGSGSAADMAVHMHHSNTILHSGSNVINSEYGGAPSNQF
jgi:hypothetical protein